MEIDKKNLKQLIRDLTRLQAVLENIKIKEDINVDREIVEDLLNMVEAYFKDSLYFLSQRAYIESLELEAYAWGILDALANLNLIEIPNEMRKWFKIEQ